MNFSFSPTDPDCWLARHVANPLGLSSRRNADMRKLLCAQLLLGCEGKMPLEQGPMCPSCVMCKADAARYLRITDKGSITELQHCRGGKGPLEVTLANIPWSSRATYSHLPRMVSRWLLSISKDRGSKISLGNPCQYLVTLCFGLTWQAAKHDTHLFTYSLPPVGWGRQFG